MLRAIDEGSASIVNLLLSRGALPYKKGVVSDMLLNRRCFLIPPALLMKVNYDEVTPLKLARNRKKGSNETIHSAIIAAMVSGNMLIYLCNTWHSLSSYRMNLLILFSMAYSLGTETVGSVTRFARRCKKSKCPAGRKSTLRRGRYQCSLRGENRLLLVMISIYAFVGSLGTLRCWNGYSAILNHRLLH